MYLLRGILIHAFSIIRIYICNYIGYFEQHLCCPSEDNNSFKLIVNHFIKWINFNCKFPKASFLRSFSLLKQWILQNFYQSKDHLIILSIYCCRKKRKLQNVVNIYLFLIYVFEFKMLGIIIQLSVSSGEDFISAGIPQGSSRWYHIYHINNWNHFLRHKSLMLMFLIF